MLQEELTIDHYEGIARIYNELAREGQGLSRGADLAPIILRFFDEHAEVPAGHTRTLLDLGCGTGQLSLFFLDRGFHVEAVDASAAMIAAFRRNAPTLREPRLTLHHATAETFRVRTPCHLGVSIYYVLNHLESIAQLRAALHSLWLAVIPGGYCLLDLKTAAHAARQQGIQYYGKGTHQLFIRNEFDAAQRLHHQYFDFFVDLGDADLLRAQLPAFVPSGIIARAAARFARAFRAALHLHLFPLAEVAEAMHEVGWREITFLTPRADRLVPVDGDPESCDVVIIAAKRQG